MKFRATLAFNCCCYGPEIEIEAPDRETAIKEAFKVGFDSWNPDPATACDHRIVEMTNESDEIIVEDHYESPD